MPPPDVATPQLDDQRGGARVQPPVWLRGTGRWRHRRPG